MITSLFNNVLIEQAELNRHQQRQLREQSPKLQAIVRFLNNMRDITVNKKHSRGAVKLDIWFANSIL